MRSPEDVSHRHGHGDQGQGFGLCNRNHGQEVIIGLPTDMFYNTGISTYVWIVNRPHPHPDRWADEVSCRRTRLLAASWKAGFVNDVAANQSWARPVRFSLADRGETNISSATGEEILHLSHEGFCDMLRDLKIDPKLETVLRSSIPARP